MVTSSIESNIGSCWVMVVKALPAFPWNAMDGHKLQANG